MRSLCAGTALAVIGDRPARIWNRGRKPSRGRTWLTHLLCKKKSLSEVDNTEEQKRQYRMPEIKESIEQLRRTYESHHW